MDAVAHSRPVETVTVTAPRPVQHKSDFWEGNSFSIHDVLDAINPLQHLPVISMIYRAITGDTIGNVARVVGDGIYGGLIGLASGLADVAMVETTGKDIGQNIIGLFEGHDHKAAAAPTAKPPASAPPAAAAPAAVAEAAGSVLPACAAVGAVSARAADPISGGTAAPPPAAAAQAAAAAPQGATLSHAALGPLDRQARFIPIDTSAGGILALRAGAAARSPRPVPLDLPSGLLAPAATHGLDFAAKMRDGLDKYSAMIAAQQRAATPDAGAAIDQLH